MVDYLVRNAERGDLPSIRALIYKVKINPMGLNWTRFLVAVTPGNELVGCGQIKLHRDGSRELASIAVHEQARDQGVARTIIEQLLKREPVRPLFLMCRARLMPFYTKFGFTRIDYQQMPPYLRCISRVERIFSLKAHLEDRLTVMWLI